MVRPDAGQSSEPLRRLFKHAIVRVQQMNSWCSSGALDLHAVSTRKKAAFVELLCRTPAIRALIVEPRHSHTRRDGLLTRTRRWDPASRRVRWPRSTPAARPLNSPFSSEPRVGACCLASMDSTARRGSPVLSFHRPTQRVLTPIPTMEMEAILAKMVSGRIASVLIW